MAEIVYEATMWHDCYDELRALRTHPLDGTIARCSCGRLYRRASDVRETYWAPTSSSDAVALIVRQSGGKFTPEQAADLLKGKRDG